MSKLNLINLNKDKDDDKKMDYHEVFVETTKPSSNYIKATVDDMDMIYELYLSYSNKFNFVANYSREYLREKLFNPNVDTYVIKNNENVVDFVSYYTLLCEHSNTQIISSYLYLYTSLNTSPSNILKNTLRLVSFYQNSDVFIINDMLQNTEALLTESTCLIDEKKIAQEAFEYKFMQDTSYKKYLNLFNWTTYYMKSNQLCIGFLSL
jgi:hypothetical protein